MENKLSKGQLICVKTLVTKLGVKDSDVMAIGFSGGRTGHVSELWSSEAIEMIKHLKSMDPDEVAADKMRKKMIGLCYEYNGLSRDASKGEKLAAIKRMEEWVRKYGHGCANGRHKAFNAYTVKELPMLVAQFQKVYKEFLKKV